MHVLIANHLNETQHVLLYDFKRMIDEPRPVVLFVFFLPFGFIVGRSKQKQLVIYAKLLSDCIIPETHFLTNITIEQELCTASCVTQKIKNVLAARGVSLHKVTHGRPIGRKKLQPRNHFCSLIHLSSNFAGW